MYVCEGLRLNRFRDVAIPANKDYFRQYGFLSSIPGNFIGDEKPPQDGNKIDVLAAMDEYDRMMQAEENSKSE